MAKKDDESILPMLIGVQRSLVSEEDKIIKMLDVLKKLKNKLMLEQLELETLKLKDLDQRHNVMSQDTGANKSTISSKYNYKVNSVSDANAFSNSPQNIKLDLSVGDDLKNMVLGNYYAEESEDDSDDITIDDIRFAL